MNRSKPTIDVTTNSFYTHKSGLQAKIKWYAERSSDGHFLFHFLFLEKGVSI